MSPKAPPFVAVRWNDAHCTGPTTTYELHELPHKALEITTYGLLLRDDADGVCVAGEHAGVESYRAITFVPRPLIIEVRPIEQAKRRKRTEAE